MADFTGASVRPTESNLVRESSAFQVRRNKFTEQIALSREAFLNEWQSRLNDFAEVVTAEFQITAVEVVGLEGSTPASLPARVQTRVRYEIVGGGTGFHREQRIGNWELNWVRSSSGEFQIRAWRTLDEMVARSRAPVYVDVTSAALSGNSSYAAQLLHGTDYWRTVLDGASGIDIYGHNGVSVADIDNDGFDDLYVCQPSGLPNRLYRNRGNGTFEDITESSGLGILENTACALFADFSNRGRQDVIIVRASGPLLFVNEGGGKFRQKPDAFHFASPPQGTFTGAAAADYNRDGLLDVYFCLYAYYQGTGQYKYPSPYHDAENGPPNFLMRNNGDGTFHDVTAESGLNQNNTRYSFCCGWSDYNSDGWPDLYVVNDFGRKNLYRNQWRWHIYRRRAAKRRRGGCRGGDERLPGSTSITTALTIFTSATCGPRPENASRRRTTLRRSLPARLDRSIKSMRWAIRCCEIAGTDVRRRRVRRGVGMGRWAWSSDAFDFDHDGFPDLYIANGMVSGPQRQDLNSFFWRQVVALSPDQAGASHEYEQGWNAINELIRSDGTWSGYERNVFYANNRDGTFSDVSAVIGLDFVEDGRSFALADFDGDGRLELFLKNRNAPQLRILKNVMEELPASIAFHLQGTKSNRDAIGASVTIETVAGRQTRIVQAGSGFLSQHSKNVFFGLGEAKGIVRASIHWPSGLVQELRNLPINHKIWVEEGLEPSRMQPFDTQSKRRAVVSPAGSRGGELLPSNVETWLLAPIAAPDFSLPDLSGKVHALSSSSWQPHTLEFLDSEVY